MTLPPSGVNIFADNVYLQPPVTTESLDEHAEEARQVVLTDRMVEDWRRELLADLADAEFFRTELRNALELGDESAAEFNDAELAALVGLRLQRGQLDYNRVDRVTRTVEDFPEDWSAEDLARAVRSAIHPLSSDESQVTAALPAVATTDVFAVHGPGEPRQPAMTQLPPSDHPDGLRP